MLTRRTLLENTLKISAGLALTSGMFAEDTPSLTLRLANAAPVEVPANFMGLGYEMSSVAPLGLLSPANQRYVNLARGLGAEGVVRVGGIVANYTRYEPNGTIVAERRNTVISRASLDQFAAFLGKIGWTAIWSVNFAQGTIQDAVQEARAVADVLGSRLLALEIGNEVDTYGRGQPFRPPSYGYETYRNQYRQWRAAIVKAVPDLRFAAPDTASKYTWAERMATDSSGEVQLLTTHYYRDGRNRGTAEQLLFPDPRLKEMLTGMRAASRKSGIPWRMCETNSFSGGGRPGISNTFVDALWLLDYMLLLAEYECSGVNIETGVNQLGFISSYSPIQDNGKGINTAGVPYYGMLAFAVAMEQGRQLLPSAINTEGINLTAYVVGSGGKPRSVVIVNKDISRDARISFAELGMGRMSVLRLSSPAPDSTTDVTFGGALVDAKHPWSGRSREHVRNGMVSVPRMSAAVLRSADRQEHV